MVEMVKIVDNKEKHYEAKEYLVCIIDKEFGTKEWEIFEGRTAAYEYLKNEIENIDLEESFVLVEGLDLSKRKSVYKFMRYVGDLKEDNFDIDDYISSDKEDDEYYSNNNYLDEFNNVNRLDMENFINGEIQTNNLQ